jgi:hypothetical protein
MRILLDPYQRVSETGLFCGFEWFVHAPPERGGRSLRWRVAAHTVWDDVVGIGRWKRMLTDFYVAFATVCFTLLGLWIIVVQTRHADWRRRSVHRRRAYGVALHFSLPGVMGLLSLIDPASTALWRISFAIAAAGGAIVLVLVRGPAPTWLGMASYAAAVLLYALIAVVAIAPSVVADLGISARPLRVEAVLLTILVFLGVNVAWLLLFDETSSTGD